MLHCSNEYVQDFAATRRATGSREAYTLRKLHREKDPEHQSHSIGHFSVETSQDVLQEISRVLAGDGIFGNRNS